MGNDAAVDEEQPTCICGCGEQTKGGKFRPGHDAKYKSTLINEALAGNNPEAEAILEERGWTKFLDKRREVLARPPREHNRKPKEPNLRAGEILQIMKAAAKVLKWTGQYRRGTVYHIPILGENALAIATLKHPSLRPVTGVGHEPFSPREQAAIDAALADLDGPC